MIRVICHTNLDEYKHEEWPSEMLAVPSSGDWVEAASGKVLQVVKVTHCQRQEHTGYTKRIAVLRVELHKC